MSSKVQVVPGCRVNGSHGKLRPNPNGKKRRIKEKIMGIVISTVGPNECNVLFDYNGKVKKMTLIVSPLACIPLHVPDLQVSQNGSITIMHEAKWSNSYLMFLSFITQETVDGSLDSSNFDATNEIEDTLNSIISSIKESWDSNSDNL